MTNFQLFRFIIFLPMIGYAAANLIHSVELTKMDSTLVTMLKQNFHPRDIEAMMRTDDGTIPVPLVRFMDNDFYGEVLFGHPGQSMRVSFDTSWIDSWVPTITCSAVSPACATRRKYDPNRSPFSIRTQLPFEVPFGSEKLAGRVFYDLVHINQVNITKQGFGAVSEIPFVFVYSKFDGIFGLNFGENDVIPQVIFNLQKQGKIQRKVFSFYFNRNPASKKGGTLVFGGVEPRHYKGNFTFVNVIPDKDYTVWKFQVNNISVTTPERKTNTVCKSGCTAIAATGSNPISGPWMEIDDLNQAIKARQWFLGRYQVDCNTVHILPQVTFSIGSRNFTLTGKDYVQEIQVSHLFTLCLSSFKANTDRTDTNWYIGGAFMSRYYTTFDMDLSRIGFADAKL
uniref:Lysosomal aspartic protease n=1 Tax=Lygus hesperus TaxID=30085 RepID=A0A146LU58_LYGHE